MSVINAAIVTQSVNLPEGVTFAGINVTLTDGANFNQTVAADLSSNTATFANVPPGTYTATAQAVDSSGGAIGPATQPSNPVTVAALTFPQPQTVTLTLAS